MLPETQETAPLHKPVPKWRYWWVGFMALCLIVSLFANRARLVTEAVPQSEAFERIFSADFSLRYYYFSQSIFSRFASALSQHQTLNMLIEAQALPSARKAARLAPQSVRAYRMVGFSLLLLGRNDEALKAFEKGASVSKERQVSLDEERAFWRAVCAKSPPISDQVARLEKTADSLNLRWYRHIAMVQIYRQAGLASRARAEESLLYNEASLPILKILILFAILGFLGLAGLVIGAIYFLVRLKKRPHPWPWTLHLSQLDLFESFLFWIFVLMVLEYAAALMKPASLAPPMRLVFSLSLYSLAGVCGLALLAVRASQQDIRLAELGLSLKNLGKNLLWGLGGYLAALPLLVAAAFFSAVLADFLFKGMPTPINPAVPMMAQSEGWIMKLLALALVSVAAPIFEEIFFRGVLYQAIRMRVGVRWAVLISAACFAIVHPQLPVGFLPIFVLGVVFACLYEYSHSLIPSVVAHGLNNGIAFLFVTTLFPK